MTTLNLPHYKSQSGCRCFTALGRKRVEHAILGRILLVGLFFTQLLSVGGQTFTTIYNFSLTSPSPPLLTSTNSDGVAPWCTLSLSTNTLYGTASTGGSGGKGTVFKLGTDGSGFATLHNFSYTSDIQPFNSDGITPLVGLALSGNTLYGTAYLGGTGANGTVFSVGTNGTSFQTLHSFTAFGTGPFTNSDGATPISDLVVVGNVIYGSTSGGGPTGVGTLFRMNTNGSAFGIFNNLTNIVGGEPLDVTFSNNVLYGATAGGGDFNNGTIFRIGVDGTGLTVLYSFTGRNDGAQPAAGVLLSGEVLFGTTHVGGASGQGTVFKLNLDGSGFATLHSFTTNEGTPNWGRLVLVGHNLFGIASYGLQGGTVYTLGTNGTGFTILHTFSGGNDGGLPKGGLVSSGTTLYGTTSAGGAFGSGTVFSLSLLPNLAIVPRGQNVVLTWPTNYAGIDYTGYALQSATNLGPEAIWTTNLPAPVVINGQNTVTNPVSLTQQFFRLSQ